MFARAAEVLRTSGLSEARELLTASSREARHECVEQCNLWLEQHHRDLYNGLRACTIQASERMLALVEQVTAPTSGRACIVSATGYGPGADEDHDAEAVGKAAVDRYLSLLTTLFERTFALLRSKEPGGHEVRAWVASRDVSRPGYTHTSLQPSDVGDAVQRAATFPFFAASGLGDARVRIHPEAVPRYDARVHPGIVIADFVANRLRRLSARGVSRGWCGVSRLGVQLVRNPLEARSRATPHGDPLPTLASDGPARIALRRALGAGGPLGQLAVPWQADETSAWLTALQGAL